MAPKELIQKLADQLQASVESQREFQHWPCHVAKIHHLDGESIYLSCALDGFRKPRVFLRDMTIDTSSEAGKTLADAESKDGVKLSGAFGRSGPHWADVTVENCGLDLRIPAESAIFLEVSVQQARR